MDRRRKPAIREPRPELTMDEMRAILSELKEIESVTGIRYIKLHVTAKMIIGIRESSGKEFTIKLDFGRVELALLRLDACPLDGKAVGVQPGICQQADIFLIPIIMVAGNAARLGKACVRQLLLRPVVGMNVVALDLMGGSGRADKETFFKFLHNFLLTCAVHSKSRNFCTCIIT